MRGEWIGNVAQIKWNSLPIHVMVTWLLACARSDLTIYMASPSQQFLKHSILFLVEKSCRLTLGELLLSRNFVKKEEKLIFVAFSDSEYAGTAEGPLHVYALHHTW